MVKRDDAIRTLYGKYAPILNDWEMLLYGLGEDSKYRKKAVDSLQLNSDSKVLDVACGTGLNFKAVESYLGNSGKLVGVDISPYMLKAARNRVTKHGWKNVELVNVSFADYEPGTFFDAALCTFAIEIIPDYESVIDKIFRLLKPQGRFAMIGMKLSSRMPYKLANPIVDWFGRIGGVDYHCDAMDYIRSKYSVVDFEEFLGGFFYILSASKSSPDGP